MGFNQGSNLALKMFKLTGDADATAKCIAKAKSVAKIQVPKLTTDVMNAWEGKPKPPGAPLN